VNVNKPELQIHTKHINTLCGQNVEFVNVKPGGTYSNHWALEGTAALLQAWRQEPIDICKLKIPEPTTYRMLLRRQKPGLPLFNSSAHAQCFGST
jgi:hypothetical protein